MDVFYVTVGEESFLLYPRFQRDMEVEWTSTAEGRMRKGW